MMDIIIGFGFVFLVFLLMVVAFIRSLDIEGDLQNITKQIENIKSDIEKRKLNNDI